MLGSYDEVAGKTDAAQAAYLQALHVNGDLTFYPDWNQSDLRRTIAQQMIAQGKYSAAENFVLALDVGQVDNAQQFFDQFSTTPPVTSASYIYGEILALAQQDQAKAEAQLALARKISPDPDHDPWIHLGLARLAQFTGNKDQSNQEKQLAHDLMAATTQITNNTISAISFTQYRTKGLTDYYLPTVYAPLIDPIFADLLAHTGS
jgi:hypothetical protein